MRLMTAVCPREASLISTASPTSCLSHARFDCLAQVGELRARLREAEAERDAARAEAAKAKASGTGGVGRAGRTAAVPVGEAAGEAAFLAGLSGAHGPAAGEAYESTDYLAFAGISDDIDALVMGKPAAKKKKDAQKKGAKGAEADRKADKKGERGARGDSASVASGASGGEKKKGNAAQRLRAKVRQNGPDSLRLPLWLLPWHHKRRPAFPVLPSKGADMIALHILPCAHVFLQALEASKQKAAAAAREEKDRLRSAGPPGDPWAGPSRPAPPTEVRAHPSSRPRLASLKLLLFSAKAP